jgi:hypothetical protein
VILSVPWLEDQVVRALLPRYRRAVQARAPPPDAKNLASLDYFVDPAARQTLQHAALAALSVHLQAEEVLSPAQLLPQVGRVLLMAEEAQAGRYLEAVAAALASEMNAGGLPPGWGCAAPPCHLAQRTAATAAALVQRALWVALQAPG